MSTAAEQGAVLDPLPPGVSLVRNHSSGPRYEGRAEALISAGLILPEWIVDLSRHTRAIVLNADGGFSMPYPDGKRGSYPNEERKRGLTTIKRLQGTERLQVQKYRTKEEEREIEQRWRERVEREDREREMERQEQKDRRAQNQAFQDGVKEASVDRAGEYLDKMHACLSATGGVAYSADSEARILRLLDELRRAFAEARMVPVVPMVAKYRTEGNVIHFPRAAGGQGARP